MSESAPSSTQKALYRVLRPLVRLLIRNGLSYRQFAEIAQRVFIESAEQDFALNRRKASNARTAVLTGINRKDIAKLKERPHPIDTSSSDRANPASSIITAWLNDPRCREGTTPKDLPLEHCKDFSFSDLSKAYCRDVPIRALLDELVRINAIRIERQQDDSEYVKLLVRAYVPLQNIDENMRVFARAAHDLLSTMDHNIAQLAPGKFIQRSVVYEDIPEELLNKIRNLSEVQGQEFLLKVNDWLAQCDRQENKDLVGSGRYRAGIGLYYFEHDLDQDDLRMEDDDQ